MASLGYELAPGTLGRPQVMAAPEAARRLSPRSRSIVWLTLAFWLSNFALLTLGSLLSDRPNLAAVTGMRALAMLFGLALCGLIHWVLTRPNLTTLAAADDGAGDHGAGLRGDLRLGELLRRDGGRSEPEL